MIENAISRLSGAIKIKTISHIDYSTTDLTPFREFLEYLEKSFPLVYKTCEVEKINEYSLLIRIKGKEEKLLPILFMAHIDVVPASEKDGWTHPPFSGEIADGYVWGRGTLDIKSQLLSHLEALTNLLKKGFIPSRDLYFAYGHDEEVDSGQGADKIVEVLAKRGLKFAGVLDEGGIVVDGAIKGVKSPLALIGVAEKGRSDFEISVLGDGGHSSMPPKSTALGKLAEVIRRIEQHPLPSKLTSPVVALLENISGELGIGFATKNLWLFSGLIKSKLEKAPETNSMIRTTFAATMASASDAENVLPLVAKANINVRLLQGDTNEDISNYFKKLAGDIPIEIKITTIGAASPVSPASGELYELIKNTTKEFYPEAIISPYLVSGGTDSRKYVGLSDYIYRFSPIRITNAEKNTIHNIDERISIKNYENMILFFQKIMESI
jgi:carboxypeptidase PM20D1